MIKDNLRFGAIYLAFGIPYLAMALVSFRSLRRSNPSVPVCIITNVAREPDEWEGWDKSMDIWKFVDLDTSANRDVKTAIFEHSPFDNTLYLDCDTLVLGDVSLGWMFLEYFDVAFKGRPTPQNSAEKGNESVLQGRHFINQLPHWNSGVFLFRKNERVHRFFTLWKDRFRSCRSPYDQVSLVEAIFESDIRMLNLDQRWNLQTGNKFFRDKGHAIIIHYTSDIDEEVARMIIDSGHALETRFNIDAAPQIIKFILSKRTYRINKEGAFRYRTIRLMRRIRLALKKARAGDTHAA